MHARSPAAIQRVRETSKQTLLHRLCLALGFLALGAWATPAQADFEATARHKQAYVRYKSALTARDLESALIHARNAVQYASEELGPRHTQTGILVYNLGSVQLKLEHNRDATNSLRRAVSIYRAVYGKDAADSIGPYDKLGRAFEGLKQWSGAERAYAEKLRLIEHNTPSDYRAIASALLRLATVAEELEAHQRVRNYSMRMVRALEADPQDRAIEVGVTHLRLARNELARGDGRLALKHMEVAIPIYEEKLPADDPRLERYYEFMAQAYDLLGKHSTSRKYEKRLERSRAGSPSDD
jgi:hypothetical protein